MIKLLTHTEAQKFEIWKIKTSFKNTQIKPSNHPEVAGTCDSSKS